MIPGLTKSFNQTASPLVNSTLDFKGGTVHLGKFLLIYSLLYLMLFLQIIQYDITKILIIEVGEFYAFTVLIGVLIGWLFGGKNYNQLFAIILAPIVASVILSLIIFAAVSSCENLIKIKNPFTNALITTLDFSYRIFFLSTLPSMIGCFVTFKICKRANKIVQPDGFAAG